MTATANNKANPKGKNKADKKITAIRGMNDILSDEVVYWQHIEQELKNLTKSYDYTEIKLPIVEHTELFKRSVGDVTDIVEKEMYTFEDRNSDSLTLRPEGTAGVVRAGIEHSLFYGNNPKIWYYGPMFRHERPQKGRYRQFYQFGMEAFGYNSGHIDVEMLVFCARLWKNLGLDDHIRLELNCLGTPEVRRKYTHDLVNYFDSHYDRLDEDSKKRLSRNPLRILDSKNPDLAELIKLAPKLSDYLDEISHKHMAIVTKNLDSLNIKYTLNPYLVRGLDYYSLTVFEWVTDKLGAQGTVCAGGRYDSLVEQLGGNSTPAIGLSIGIERLVLLLKEQLSLSNSPDVFLALVGDKALDYGLTTAEKLRDSLPNISILVNTTGQSFKNQLKKADKSGAKIAIIIGENEIENQCFTVKYLRSESDLQNTQQITVESFDKLLKVLEF